ncbi:MAG: LysR family transcriptional regulator [Leucobacter sp.]
MELRTLHYFVAVCEAGSFHAAASKVHVAQPSLSRQIRALEGQLGFALFQRTPRGAVLTTAGRAYLPIARDLLMRADRAGVAAQAIAQGGATSLTVVAASTTITDVVAPFVASADTNKVIANAVEAYPESVYSVLERGDADFAIGTLAPPDGYESLILGRAYVWAMAPEDHPIAQLDRVPLESLLEHPLIVMDRAHRARQIFDSAVADSGLGYTARLQTSVAALAQGLAASGRGIAILSDDPIFGLATAPITHNGTDLSITLYGVWEKGHYATTKITECLANLGRFNQQVYPALNPARALGGQVYRGLAPAE